MQQGQQAAASPGDVVPGGVGKRGYPTQKKGEDVPVGQFVTCHWPVFITFYKGNKFNELQEMAKGAGRTVKLKGRFNNSQTKPRNCVLTVKGVAAREVFRTVWQRTKEMGADMSKVPLAVVDEEEMKTKEAPLALMGKEEESAESKRARTMREATARATDQAHAHAALEDGIDWGIETEMVEEKSDVVLRSRSEAQAELRVALRDDDACDVAQDEVKEEVKEDDERERDEDSVLFVVHPFFVRSWEDVLNESLQTDDVVSVLEDEVISASTATGFAKEVVHSLIEHIPERHRHVKGLLDRITDEMPTHPEVEDRIAVFCGTCFRRGFQVKKVLPWNLLTMLPYRDVVRYDLMLFGPEEEDTKDVLNFIHKKLNWAIQARILRVAVAPMKCWSAPEAKNTSHVFGCSEPKDLHPDKRLLVNTDSTPQPESLHLVITVTTRGVARAVMCVRSMIVIGLWQDCDMFVTRL